MRRLFVSMLVLAAVGVGAGVSNAQKGLSTGPNLDGIENARRIEENAMRALDKPRKAGLEALQAQNFTQAETSFTELLSKNPTTSDANYLMGLAKMGLKKWAEARTYLEKAIVAEPKRPEPKARLAVTYIMINEMDAAAKQRADLTALASQCTGGCTDGKRIADNIGIVDKVLASIEPKPAATPG